MSRLARVTAEYADTIGCLLLKVDHSNIVEYPVVNSRERRFVSLINIDPQCSGGSAMGRSVLISLIETDDGKVFVIPEESFPVAENNRLPQYIDKIYTKNGDLWFSGKDFDQKKDPLCCPSVPIKGRLMYSDGNWSAADY